MRAIGSDLHMDYKAMGQTTTRPYTLRRGQTVEDVAELVHKAPRARSSTRT